jgi:hypothetical protein
MLTFSGWPCVLNVIRYITMITLPREGVSYSVQMTIQGRATNMGLINISHGIYQWPLFFLVKTDISMGLGFIQNLHNLTENVYRWENISWKLFIAMGWWLEIFQWYVPNQIKLEYPPPLGIHHHWHHNSYMHVNLCKCPRYTKQSQGV